MAITATLVYAGHNRLTYLITTDTGNETVSIESDGGASPDLLTDSLAGPLKQIARVKTNGYGKIAAGGITTDAQARALLLSDDAADQVGAGGRPPTAIARLSGRDSNGWRVDAVRGPTDTGTPGIQVTKWSNGGGSCYLDVFIPGAIGGC